MIRRTHQLTGWFLAALVAVPAAAFDEFQVGARPAALSGAFSAMADDTHSLYYNPAGLVRVTRPEISAYYGRLFPNLSDQTKAAQTVLSAAGSLGPDGRWGAVGGGYQEFRVDSLFSERTLTLGYGRAWRDGDLRTGMNLKMLRRQYGSDADTMNAILGNNPANRTGSADPVFGNGSAADAVGLDVGAQYDLPWNLTSGLSLTNLNRPDLGLSSREGLPLLTRLGIAYRRRFLRAEVDLTHRRLLTGDADQRLLLGAERTWMLKRYGDVTVRGGAGVGNRQYRQWTLGGGYEINGMVVDYVFTIPLGAADETGQTHNLSLSYKFGRSPADDEILTLVARENEATRRAQAAAQMAEAEAAFIKEERNKLLIQYSGEIERLKAELAEARKNHAPPTPAKKILTAEERERAARAQALREYTTAFEAALRAYNRQAESATLTRRASILEDILAKYTPLGVDTTRATREYDRVKVQIEQMRSDYQASLSFYRVTVSQGADPMERVSLLERMLKKYARAGIDLSEIEKELAKVRKN
jgi:hypothetical protein